MKTRWLMAVCMTVFFAFTGNIVVAQDHAPGRSTPGPPTLSRPALSRNELKLSQNRNHQTPIKLDDHDRQIIRDWYKPDRDKVLLGLQDSNGVTPYVDSRLRIGSVPDANLPIRRSAFIEFWHRLTSSPRSYQYVAFQGHVQAIDDNYQDMNDLIHFKLYF
jgi:hypothetical protein